LSGSNFINGAVDDGPMKVQMPKQDEPEVVASGSISKSYSAPAGMSNVAFDTLYVNALKQAGWTIVDNSESMHQTDVAITAHYTRNDRNLWSYIHYAGGEYSIQLADAGAEQLAAALAKKCHVPVYGVLFDFNKATLRPDSEGELNKVREVFTADPSLKLIVEGHTDNVGGAVPNQKLSEQRAASVVAWLTAHGVPANRVSAKGYGLTRPVASNDDAEGRAKNRRVELRKEGCNS
ncbi:MAG TPA: OmpA family protein, partial [Thermoanaerobaculia bacterium]|nr:OmpA family protein [Thermoanaerobaculia bacterium]